MKKNNDELLQTIDTPLDEMVNTLEEVQATAAEVAVVDELHEVEEAPVMTDGMEEEEEQNYKEMSPARLIARRFFRSRLSIVGLIMVVFLFLFAFLGPVVYDKWAEDEYDASIKQDSTYATYTTTDADGNEITFVEHLTHEQGLNNYAKPSKDHLLGTDEAGLDIFVRLMYGGRISLAIGLIVVLLETLIGIILGGLAGYFGGWVDQTIMRIVDIFNCIPTLPILLIASAVIDANNVPPDNRIYLLMVIITLFSWSGVARLVRGQILSLREQEYITATEVMGLPTWRRIFRHLIPNVMPQLIVSMTLGLGSVILYESTLSYLGLGVQFPHAAWGTMISAVNKPEVLKFHTNMWLPAGALIAVAVLGFNFIGDGLRDAMDPKARK